MTPKTMGFLPRIFKFLAFVPALMLSGSYSTAAEYTLVPSITISGEYNNNVSFDRAREREDYLTTLSPGMEFSSETDRGNVKAEIIADFLRYADETSLDTENLYAGLDGTYKVSERSGISGKVSYIDDTTLESDLFETGLVSTWTDRKRYNAGFGSTYNFTQTTDIGVDYRYSNTTYSLESNEDYYTHWIGVSCNYRFPNQLDVLTVQPYYSNRKSDISDADNYGLSLGWTRMFTETHRLKIFLGTRYTDLREKGESDTSWGGVADVKLMKKGELFSGDVGYSRDIHNNVYGELIEVDRIYCNVDRKIIGRLGVGFSGNLYFTRSERERDGDTSYFEVIPFLNYQLTENHSLKLAYSYAEDDDEQSPDRRANRSRVWIALNFNMPKKW